MRRSWLALVAVTLCSSPALAEERWEPAKTHALFVGVLAWKDRSLAPFPKENRQDRALEKELVARGVPAANVRFLEDEAATLVKIREELAAALDRAGEDSTFVFYFAGHGLREDGGKTYLANHDCDTTDDEHTAFGLEELRKTLHQRFKGTRLLLLADCCHSGALGAVVRSFDGSSRVKAACLTSATASNVSTGRWTFTESLVAAFRREGSVDLDRNGTITFSEVDDYVHREMRWREEQLTRAARSRTFEADLAIVTVDPAKKVPDVKGAWKLGQYAECSWEDEWYPVRVIDAKDGKLRVHYLGWGDDSDEWVDPRRLRKQPPLGVRPGDACEVEWKGKWWKAKAVSVDECFAFVRYDGFGPEWDEWVTAERIRHPAAKQRKRKK